jgi:hypothetical protein
MFDISENFSPSSSCSPLSSSSSELLSNNNNNNNNNNTIPLDDSFICSSGSPLGNNNWNSPATNQFYNTCSPLPPIVSKAKTSPACSSPLSLSNTISCTGNDLTLYQVEDSSTSTSLNKDNVDNVYNYLLYGSNCEHDLGKRIRSSINQNVMQVMIDDINDLINVGEGYKCKECINNLNDNINNKAPNWVIQNVNSVPEGLPSDVSPGNIGGTYIATGAAPTESNSIINHIGNSFVKPFFSNQITSIDYGGNNAGTTEHCKNFGSSYIFNQFSYPTVINTQPWEICLLDIQANWHANSKYKLDENTMIVQNMLDLSSN